MRLLLVIGAVLAMSVAGGLEIASGTAHAHEGREVGDYRLVVGWLVEPTYEGQKNAVYLRVWRPASEGDHDGQEDPVAADGQHEDAEDSDVEGGHHEDAEDSDAESGHHEDAEDEGSDEDDHSSGIVVSSGKMASPAPQSGGANIPVEGLQSSLLVEVTHVSSETSKVLRVYAVSGEPGSYAADIIPTAAGVYGIRVFGSIDGTAVDEMFLSKGGGGDFDDVLSPAALQFPVELPETRELESAVRGAIQTAQQAQDAALAAEAGSGTDVLVIVVLVLACTGSATGLLALYLALRRR